jgi:hypothetical protein
MIEQPTDLVAAFANRTREPKSPAHRHPEGTQATRSPRDIGPIGTAARLVLGVFFVGIIVGGQLMTSGHLSPITWVLGLLGFPALVLAWHFWRVRHHPSRFSDTSPLGFVLSLALPLACYLIGLYVPALWFTSDATLIFVGSSMVLAGFRGSAGCDFLAFSNWLLHRTDQIACAIWTPIDALEQRRSRS